MDSQYSDERYVGQRLQVRSHRQFVGGLWEEIGTLQLEFMKSVGLQPHDLLLDVGCGALRGGVKFIAYLNRGNYFGIDISQSLLDTAYAQEILADRDLAEKLPRHNLKCTDSFAATSFGKRFHYALAQSVFTHLTLNSIRLCFENLHAALEPAGKFCATYFDIADDQLSATPRRRAGNVITYGYQNPYHYRLADFRHVISGLPWSLDDELDCSHPRGQRMLVFSKTA